MLNPVTLALAPALLGSSAALAADDREARSPVPVPEVAGLVQVWGTVYDQDVDPVADPAAYGDPEDDPGFKVRRARIGLQGRESGIRYDITFGYGAPYDAVLGNGTELVGVVDASGGFRIAKGLWIDGGILKVPVGREFLFSAADLALGDRAVGSVWMVPGRDAGVVLDGNLGEADGLRGRLRLGAFNGNGRILGDDNPGKLLSARLEAGLGPGSTYRTYGKVDGLTLGVAGDFWTDRDLGTKTTGYGGDLLVRVEGLALLVEGHLATIEPTDSDLVLPGVLATTPRLGAVAQVGYSVGPLEPVVRASLFDDHRDIEDNGDVADVSGGITWHGEGDAVRAGALFVKRLELGGVSVENDSARLWMQLRL